MELCGEKYVEEHRDTEKCVLSTHILSLVGGAGEKKELTLNNGKRKSPTASLC